jgi:SWI/SNF-related matrix-associated actin-dependent regulator 1 of chromatin subfamily A
MILKRLAGEGKIDAAMEWIDTFLDSTSRKLVVFAHHKAVVNALADKYGGMRVAGADSMKARQEVIDKFQSDDDARVIVLNMKAGGVGITLTAASDVLFVEQGWTPAEHDQATDRCHRIGQDASVVSSWYLLADGTIDDALFELIEAKRIVVDAVTDGEDDLAVSVMNGLIDKLVKRAND